VLDLPVIGWKMHVNVTMKSKFTNLIFSQIVTVFIISELSMHIFLFFSIHAPLSFLINYISPHSF